MPIHGLRTFDETSAGVTLPKDDLRLEGLVDENGELLVDEQNVLVRYEGDGEWSIELLDGEVPQ